MFTLKELLKSYIDCILIKIMMWSKPKFKTDDIKDNKTINEYLSWDEYFMSVAILCALRSKDPNTKNGAVIVDSKKRIISTGYNGFPHIKDNDNIFPWGKENKEDNKYNYVIHAECNAILNSNKNLENCILYLYSQKNYLPCQECAKMIVQCGIKEVVVIDTLNENTDVYNWKHTLYMFKVAHIKIRKIGNNVIQKIFKES